MHPIKVAALYAFTPLTDLPALRARLLASLKENGLRGSLLLAPEGFNGTLAGRPEAVDRSVEDLRDASGLQNFALQFSAAETIPFRRLKVRLKREIVTLGQPGIDPRAKTGTEVAPEDWNALLSDPDVVVLDVRNGFEVALGTFPIARDPETRSFSDFPAYVRSTLDPARDKRVAMFCTGGIRCEKASSFMLREGFAEVFQLKGGILAYLDKVPAEQSLWRGSCFVFDERVALGQGLEVAASTDQASER